MGIKIFNVMALVFVFTLGWMLHDVSLEQPNLITGNAVASLERASPSDIIAQDQIHVYNDRVVIEIENPEWATFTDTNSMDPVFDEGSHAIQIVPSRPEQINGGDIISFETDNGVIIHRVVETGVDEDGWYAVTKGDNNAVEDPGKVRFNSVRKLLVGIIY